MTWCIILGRNLCAHTYCFLRRRSRSGIAGLKRRMDIFKAASRHIPVWKCYISLYSHHQHMRCLFFHNRAAWVPTAFSPEMCSPLWICALRRLYSDGFTFYCGHLDSLLPCASTFSLKKEEIQSCSSGLLRKDGLHSYERQERAGYKRPYPCCCFCQSMLSAIGFHIR